jgi:glutaredoxin
LAKFAGLNTQVLGVSVDHVPCLEAWAESMGGITFPLMSDFWPHGQVSKLYGVLREEGYSERAIFIIDKAGIIRYIDIHDINDQPLNRELLEELQKIEPNSVNLQSELQENPLPEGDILMFCTSWCPDCKKARKWLADHQIDYVEIDINKYPQASEQVRKWADGNQVTPTFNIRGRIIIDFDIPALRDVFSIRE